MIALALWGMVPLFAFLNRLRGSGWVKGNKVLGYLGMAAAIMAGIWAGGMTIGWYYAAPLILFGVIFGFVWGWGEYFPYADKPRVAEAWIVDRMLDGLFGDHTNYITQRWVGMSLRWLVFFAPLFVAIGVLAHSWWAVLGYGLLALVGPIYLAVAKTGTDNAPSEWLCGALLGLACRISIL